MNIPPNYPGEYVNVNEAFAQGAEVVLRAKLRPRLLLNSAYTYTSSQYLDNPAPYDPIYNPGATAAAAAQAFRYHAVVVPGKSLERKSGRELCGAAGGFGFRRIWHQSRGRLCARGSRRMVRGEFARDRLRKY